MQEFLYVVWLENPKGGGEIGFWRNLTVKTISKTRRADWLLLSSQRGGGDQKQQMKYQFSISQTGRGGKNKNKK